MRALVVKRGIRAHGLPGKGDGGTDLAIVGEGLARVRWRWRPARLGRRVMLTEETHRVGQLTK